MKIALLFPGQGAQYVGMGKDLYETNTTFKAVMDEANSLLDWDLKEVCFEDSKGLIHQTRYTQAALFTVNYGIWQVIKEAGIQVAAAIGFSLGEYDAIAASGALSFKEALSLVEKRAIYMEACATQNIGGMAAVIGLDVERIKKVCLEVSPEGKGVLEVANDNCPGQVTIAGTLEALKRAEEALKEAGARRVLRLKVSGAFHTSLMRTAACKLEAEAKKYLMKPVEFPIISNVTAQPMTEKEILQYLPLQMVTGVRFRESVLNLIQNEFDLLIEVGPKTTLSNLVKKIDSNIEVRQVEDRTSLEKLMERIKD